MSIALITGSSGLVGSAAARIFASKGLEVIGIDNDMRAHFFGPMSSTRRVAENMKRKLSSYRQVDIDIRDFEALQQLFKDVGHRISVIIHAAAQPSHDWSAQDPIMDFDINANATVQLLELTRQHAPQAVFQFMSTNKVYGDASNELPLVEAPMRWNLAPDISWAKHGFDESMRIDCSTHSPFGVSKLAADVMVQEYGRYYDLKTTCFRGGCITGANHAGAELHGFLAYLTRCVVFDIPYTIYGYGGKQVRDNIHVDDLANAFWCVLQKPGVADVFNMGGSPFSNCSILEAIELCESISGNTLQWSTSDIARKGDHIWWITDTRKFQNAYPEWEQIYDNEAILRELLDQLSVLRDLESK